MTTLRGTLGLGPSPAPTYRDGSPSWQSDAACSDDQDDTFFAPDGEKTGLPRRYRERTALAICAECPVIAQCAAYAIENGEQYGIWGGLTETDRLPLIRAARKARRDAGVPMKKAIPPDHGTPARAASHRREGTPVCVACLRAERVARAEREART